MTRKATLAVLILIVASTLGAAAQEKGQKGFNFGVFDTLNVGATFHLSDAFALRTTVRYAESDRNDDFEETLYGVDLGFLHFWSGRENLWLYAGGELGYTQVQQTQRFFFGSFRIDDDMGTVRGLFGLQYTFNKKVGLYGEVGASYFISDTTDVETLSVVSSGVGIIFYIR